MNATAPIELNPSSAPCSTIAGVDDQAQSVDADQLVLESSPCTTGSAYHVQLHSPSAIRLSVYDLQGRLVANLFEGSTNALELRGNLPSLDHSGLFSMQLVSSNGTLSKSFIYLNSK